MSPRMQNQIVTSKEQSLATFVSKKIEIDTMLVRLQALSDDHFRYSPDEITWAHVGTLEQYTELQSASPTQPSTRASTPHSPLPRSPAPPRAAPAAGAQGSRRAIVRVLAHIYDVRCDSTYDIARALFGVQPTDAELSSLRRALRKLRASGFLQSWGRNRLYWIMRRGAAKRLGWPGCSWGIDVDYGIDPTDKRRRR
jgi:hypothetical protein